MVTTQAFFRIQFWDFLFFLGVVSSKCLRPAPLPYFHIRVHFLSCLLNLVGNLTWLQPKRFPFPTFNSHEISYPITTLSISFSVICSEVLLAWICSSLPYWRILISIIYNTLSLIFYNKHLALFPFYAQHNLSMQVLISFFSLSQGWCTTAIHFPQHPLCIPFALVGYTFFYKKPVYKKPRTRLSYLWR